MYSKVSQLVPAGTFAAYKVIETTVVGGTVADFSIEQQVLLWIAVSLFFGLCCGTSLIADGTVTYSAAVGKFVSRQPAWLQRAGTFVPAVAVHAIMSSAALLAMIFLNPLAFHCLFGAEPDDVVVRSVPIIICTLLLTMHTMLFDLPAETPAGTDRLMQVEHV